MTTKYVTGGGRASIGRAVKLIQGEIATGYDFVYGIGAIPRAFGKCALSTAKEAFDSFIPRIIGEQEGNLVPEAIVEIAPNTAIQASEVVTGSIARQVTGRNPIA